MEANNIKKDAIAYDEMVVTDSSGTLITGLTNSDFTKDLYNPSGDEVSGEITVTVSELGDGKYRINFTPNALGNWVVTIYNATYFTYGKSANYVCVNNLNDDIPGAVWDVSLIDHVGNTGSTGYRIKHISAASTTRVFNRGIWTKEEKDLLLKQITNLFNDLTLMKKSQESIKVIKSLDNVSGVVYEVKDLINNLRVIDNFKELKDTISLSREDNVTLNTSLNSQFDDLTNNFVNLLREVKFLGETQGVIKQDLTNDLIKRFELTDQKHLKAEELLGEVYKYIEELTGLLVKTISTERLENVVKKELE